MPEHYTRNTVEAVVWCAKCHANTRHMVQGGRRGACIECYEKQKAEAENRPAAVPQPEQGRLF